MTDVGSIFENALGHSARRVISNQCVSVRVIVMMSERSSQETACL
jgi:hypothetical protein